MAKETGRETRRFPITYFEGVNSSVSKTIAKRSELSHVENVRAPIIGVLEKREGQAKTGDSLVATGNYGLYAFSAKDYDILPVTDTQYNRLFRCSTTAADTPGTAAIYYLNYLNTWTRLVLTAGLSQTRLSMCATPDFAAFVNGVDNNFLISRFALSSTNDSTDMADAINVPLSRVSYTGLSLYSMYKSPKARKVAYYKSRMYLGDVTTDSGVRAPATVVRSSTPLGIVSLISDDWISPATIAGATLSSAYDLNVTDTKYLHSNHFYEVRRGGVKICDIQVISVQDTKISMKIYAGTDSSSTPVSGSVYFRSSDEIWAGATYSGSKRFFWPATSSTVGRDFKNYDSFTLAGGENTAITLLEPIGNVLLIGNRTSIMSWNDYSLESFDTGVGCVSDTGYVKLLGNLFFISYDGVYTTPGSVPQIISRKIDRYITGATRAGLESAVAGKKGKSVFFAIGDVTLYHEDGSTDKVLPDVCLEFNVLDQTWYVHTNVKASSMVSWLDDGGTERLIFASTDTDLYVKEFLTGDTDDGEEIFMRVDTQSIQLLNEFETYGTLNSVSAEIDRGNQSKLFVSTDNTSFYGVDGSFAKGASAVNITSANPGDTQPPIARRVKLSIRDSSKQRPRITQLALLYIPTTFDHAAGNSKNT